MRINEIKNLEQIISAGTTILLGAAIVISAIIVFGCLGLLIVG